MANSFLVITFMFSKHFSLFFKKKLNALGGKWWTQINMLKTLYCEKSNRICHFATRHPVTVHKVAIVPMDFVSKIYQDFFFQKGHYSKKNSQKGHYSKPAAFLTENSDTVYFYFSMENL